MILDRSLGHPASWLDVAFAWEKLEEEMLVKMELTITFSVVNDKGVYALIQVTASPSVFGPHSGRRPVKKVRAWYIDRNKPLSEGIYGLLWEVDTTVGLVFPIGKFDN